MPRRVGSLVERLVEVRKDLVLTRERLARIRDEHGDLIGVGDALQLVAVVRLGGNLTQGDAQPELGQALPYLVGVRAPFGLVELHHPSVLRDGPA